jgi:uncharacterized protein (DUF1778 family)
MKALAHSRGEEMETKTGASRKASRLNIRASARQKSMLQRAARIQKTTMSDFVLDTAVKAAQEVINQQKLADQTYFVLPEAGWQAFCAALDSPPRVIPTLKQLMTETGLFDEQS